MNDDDRLRRLLSDAVSDIEPENRLDELRASVHPRPKVVPMTRSRSWYAATGIIATAAVIGVIAYVTSMAIDKNTSVGPATDPGTVLPSATSTATDSASGLPSSSPTTSSATPAATGSADTKAFAVYYVGTDPRDKPVLYREFHAGESTTPVGTLAVEGLATSPLDPDYATPWRQGDLVDAKLNPNAGVIFVTLGHRSSERRPGDMTEAFAKAAVQQVVYTVQAAFQKRLPVAFYYHAKPATSVLGVAASEPIAAGKVLETCSRVSITDPNEGASVSGQLRVDGVNNAFEGSVAIYLERNGRKYLMSPTIGGWGANRLFPWHVNLDLTTVEPGTYTLVAQNDDPSGRGRPETDTRVIHVE
jgi:hypothetical protein